MHTKEKGNISEGRLISALMSKGKKVALPLGENQRYDLILDDTGQLKTVQCKTGRLRKGAVIFNACSQNPLTGKRFSYKGQCDYFGVFCPDTDKAYLVPVDKIGSLQGNLRVDPSKNGQKVGIVLAKDFEI